jgi:hypothetical protein
MGHALGHALVAFHHLLTQLSHVLGLARIGAQLQSQPNAMGHVGS